MAVVSIKKMPTDTSDVGFDGSTETQDWIVKCDSSADTAAVARDGKIMSGMTIVAQVPPYLSAHPVVTQMVVKSKHSERIGGARNIFKVRVDYAIPQPSWGAVESRPDGSGVKWNKSVSVSGDESTELTNYNTSKKPIRNSFGDVYHSNATKTYYDEVVTVSYTSDTVDADAIAAARGKINNASVTLTVTKAGLTRTVVYPAYTLKCGNARYEYGYDNNGQGQISVVIPLIFRDQLDATGTQIGWKQKIVDCGYRYKDASGNPVTSEVEVFLDGTGKKLGAGADAVFKIEQIDDAIDFSTLLAGI